MLELPGQSSLYQLQLRIARRKALRDRFDASSYDQLMADFGHPRIAAVFERGGAIEIVLEDGRRHLCKTQSQPLMAESNADKLKNLGEDLTELIEYHEAILSKEKEFADRTVRLRNDVMKKHAEVTEKHGEGAD